MNYDEIDLLTVDMIDCLDIPDDVSLPIATLVKVGYVFRGIFMQAVEGKPVSEIMVEHREFLLLADKALNAWIDALDLKFDR